MTNKQKRSILQTHMKRISYKDYKVTRSDSGGHFLVSIEPTRAEKVLPIQSGVDNNIKQLIDDEIRRFMLEIFQK